MTAGNLLDYHSKITSGQARYHLLTIQGDCEITKVYVPFTEIETNLVDEELEVALVEDTLAVDINDDILTVELDDEFVVTFEDDILDITLDCE